MPIATPKLPPPLSTNQFYILLALAREDLHAYALVGTIYNMSLGSIHITSGALYPALASLEDKALTDPAGHLPAGKSKQRRAHYAISSHGRIRLQEELTRMQHAVEIGKYAGLLDADQPPTDIQRMLLELEISSDRP
jgi:DNA-binding PadR family transcriptional regulator